MMEKLKTYFRYFCLPILLWPLFLWVFIILLPLIVLVYVVRNTEYLIYFTIWGAESLPYTDIVWTMSTPQNDLNINCCFVVDGTLSIDTFRTLINECLIKAEDGNGNLLYWKATRRIQPGYINYYWVADETFDIKDHVYELLDRTVSSEEELKEIISWHRSTELSLKLYASPWEFVLIDYVENNSKKTVVFCRLSHAIADGSALAYFLINRLARYQYPYKEEDILKYSQSSGFISRIDKFLITLKGLWTLPVVQLEFLFSRTDKNILHVNHDISGKKTLAWSKPVDLNLIKHIKNNLHTTVNDVLLGCLAMSLNDFFKENGSYCPLEVSVVFPFDIRSSPQEARDFKNKVAVVVLQLPSTSPDLLTTIRTAKKRMDALKKSGEAIGSFLCWNLLSFLLPKFMSKSFVFSTINKTTGSLSNLAGPQQAMAIGGYPLDMITFWPPQTNNQGFGVAFCSYNGYIRMGVEMDHSLSKDPQRICSIFEENVNKLTLTAS